MGTLESLLPLDLRGAAWPCGNEFVFPYPAVLQVVDIANKNDIAILGLEFFRVLEQHPRFQTAALTGYDLHFSGYWPGLVHDNNVLALDFIERNRKEGNYGFTLTSTSEKEFQELDQRR